ncbi:MAG: GIY-YIG nuclease family protein [Candidatus Aminicenantes bacterium]|nr:GIY-YIG nuclease family protein [Candidatus Aminicenantes bacterium]
MYYTYVLLSTKENKLYLGFTQDLRTRMELHRRGFMIKEKNNGSLKLIYLEACLNKKDAIRRDKYLKSFLGRKYLKIRLKKYFTSAQNNEDSKFTDF